MKDKRCFVCKYQGKDVLDTTSNLIYSKKERCHSVMLCYGHSVQLFKMGQTNFMLKYKDNFKGRFGFEEDDDIISAFAA